MIYRFRRDAARAITFTWHLFWHLFPPGTFFLKSTEDAYTVDKEVLASIKEEDTTWFSPNQTEVILKVDSSVSGYFKRRNILPNQTLVKELEDGGVLVSAKVAFDEEVLKLVRYWIPHVTVVSPVRLQKNSKKV